MIEVNMVGAKLKTMRLVGNSVVALKMATY